MPVNDSGLMSITFSFFPDVNVWIALTYEGGMMIKTRRNWPCVRLAV